MLVYLCGPIDLREEDCDWRAEAGKKLIKHGFNVYNPEAAFSFYQQEAVSRDELEAYNKDCNSLANINTFALQQSTIVLANITGCPTVGTYTELYEARSFEITVYAAIPIQLYRKSIMLRALLMKANIYPDLESLLTHFCYLDKTRIHGRNSIIGY